MHKFEYGKRKKHSFRNWNFYVFYGWWCCFCPLMVLNSIHRNLSFFISQFFFLMKLVYRTTFDWKHIFFFIQNETIKHTNIEWHHFWLYFWCVEYIWNQLCYTFYKYIIFNLFILFLHFLFLYIFLLFFVGTKICVIF